MAVNPAHRLNARTWAYQLQDVNLHDVRDLDVDVMVIDPVNDAGNRWSRDDLITMRAGDKRVLAYLSIGEAESYRPYWNASWTRKLRSMWSRPPWLGPENADWPGNYKVRYWYAEWQQIIIDEVDRTIDAGFDGVYLDIIDAFEFWSDVPFFEKDRFTLEQHMVAFVKRIADHARRTRGCGHFHIVPQNGEALLEFPDYRRVISAVGKEDVYYGVDGDGEVNHNVVTEEIIDLLESNAVPEHIQTLFVEYVEDDLPQEEKVDAIVDMRNVVQRSLPRSMAMSPLYIATRPLNRLVEQVG